MPYTKKRRSSLHTKDLSSLRKVSSQSRISKLAQAEVSRRHTRKNVRKYSWSQTRKLGTRHIGGGLDSADRVRYEGIKFTGTNIQELFALETELFLIVQLISTIQNIIQTPRFSVLSKELADAIKWTQAHNNNSAGVEGKSDEVESRGKSDDVESLDKSVEGSDDVEGNSEKPSVEGSSENTSAGVNSGGVENNESTTVTFLVAFTAKRDKNSKVTPQKRLIAFVPIVVQDGIHTTNQTGKQIIFDVFHGHSLTNTDSSYMTLAEYLENDRDTEGVFKKRRILDAVQSTVCDTRRFEDSDLYGKADLTTYTRLLKLGNPRNYFKGTEQAQRQTDWNTKNTEVNSTLQEIKVKLETLLTQTSASPIKSQGGAAAACDVSTNDNIPNVNLDTITDLCDKIVEQCKSKPRYDAHQHFVELKEIFRDNGAVKRWLHKYAPKFEVFCFQGKRSFYNIFGDNPTRAPIKITSEKKCTFKQSKPIECQAKIDSLHTRVPNLQPILKDLITGSTVYMLSRALTSDEKTEKEVASRGTLNVKANIAMTKGINSVKNLGNMGKSIFGNVLSSTGSNVDGSNVDNSSSGNSSSGNVDNSRSGTCLIL